MTELSQELASFREQWRKEVQQRKQGSSLSSQDVYAAAIRHDLTPLELYTEAVHLESNGHHDSAVILYRRAFKLDPHISAAYQRSIELSAEVQAPTQAKDRGTSLEAALAASERTTRSAADSELSTALAKLSLSSVVPAVTGSLHDIIAQFPLDTGFLPEDESIPEPVLNKLPVETFLDILGLLDVAALERFARVCRTARVLSSDPILWRDHVKRAYVSHQLHGVSFDSLLHKYKGDFRSLFVNVPRVRFDGVYIAVCHYIRPGLSENHWVNVNHEVTYHRYLRFLPDGRVISLLANDEFSPQRIVPLLKPSFRMKNLYIGHWYLHGDAIHITELTDPDWHLRDRDDAQQLQTGSSTTTNSKTTSTYKEVPHVRSGGHHQHHHNTQHHHAHHSSSNHPPSGATPAIKSRPSMLFRMLLALRSRPVNGRWNKLETVEYVSVDPDDGFETSLMNSWRGSMHYAAGGQQEKPYWFSKVTRWA